MSLKYESQDESPTEYVVDEGEVAFKPPMPMYSLVLTTAFGIVAAVQMVTGLERSILIAGFDKPAFLAGEYWRILTGAALHGGVLHVVMNGYAFYSFGRIFEMLAARAHLAIVFLLSAIGGGALSLVMAPEGLSVGASGGIVGLIGYLAVYAFRRREFISPEFRKSLLINIGFILVYGLLLYQVVDNYGHIGGLLTGAVYAVIQVPSDPFVDPRKAASMTEVIGLISIAVYIAACAFAVILIAGGG
jgi:membrane associated rhomboid family serine protease